MNTSNIEYYAVAQITCLLMRSSILRPEIPVNDKTPTWDGDIFVYEIGKDKSKKEGIKGKIPVQVKGKCVKFFPNNTYKYPVSVIDLQNYSNDGGVLYFVCLMDAKFEDFKIYYLDLLPLKMQNILIGLKPNQKTITLKFKKLPNEIERIEEIAEKVLWHRKNQMNCSKIIEINETKTHYMPFFNPDTSQVGEDIYVYTKSDEGVYIPIGCPTLSEIKRTLKQSISIDGEVFFDEYDVLENEKGNFLKVKNDLFVLNFNENQFKFNIVGTLTERLKIVRCILKMMESRKIEIAGVEVKIKTNLEDSQKDKISKIYNNLKQIHELLEVLNIDTDKLDVELINDKDTNLNLLIDAFIYRKNFCLPSGWEKHIDVEKDINFINMKIGNLKIALVLMKISENEYTFKNYFSDWALKKYIFSIRYQSGEIFDSIPFFLMTTVSDLKMDNMNFQCLRNTIRSYDLLTIESTIINKFLLELIHLYDFNEKIEVLEFALELSELILRKENDTNYIINRLQIIKRMKKFDEEAEYLVLDILSESPNIEIKCACYLLLGSKKMFEREFATMLPEEQEYFKEFPIYNLRSFIN